MVRWASGGDMRLEEELFQQMELFRERMERSWQQLMGPMPLSRFCPPIFEPPADIYETGEAVVVVLEIAGIRDQEVELILEGRSLTIRGEREMSKSPPGRIYSQVEVCYGPFQRQLTLPSDVDPEKVTVAYQDGFLEVHLPKVKRPADRRIRITAR